MPDVFEGSGARGGRQCERPTDARRKRCKRGRSPYRAGREFEKATPGMVGDSSHSLIVGASILSLFESQQGKIPGDWSPDGRVLFYYIPNPKSGTDLWARPLATQQPFIFLRTDARELWGQP